MDKLEGAGGGGKRGDNCMGPARAAPRCVSVRTAKLRFLSESVAVDTCVVYLHRSECDANIFA